MWQTQTRFSVGSDIKKRKKRYRFDIDGEISPWEADPLWHAGRSPDRLVIFIGDALHFAYATLHTVYATLQHGQGQGQGTLLAAASWQPAALTLNDVTLADPVPPIESLRLASA